MLKLTFNNEYIVTEAPIPSLTNRISELRPAHITHVLKWSELIRNLLDNMIKLLLLPWFEVVRKNLCCELHLPRCSGHCRSKSTAETEIHTRAEIPTQRQSPLPLHANYRASKLLCTDCNSTSPFPRMYKVHPIQRLSTSSIRRWCNEINVSVPSWLANENSN